MEGRLQGPINPCFLGEEHLGVEMECLEQGNSIAKLGFGSPSNNNTSFEEMRIPFLEMLQSGDSISPAFSPLCELSFQALLSLQQFKPELRNLKEQPDSCLTHDALDQVQISPVKSETMDHQVHHNTLEGGAKSECNLSKAAVGKGQKRKRVKRRRAWAKNKEEVESQRMTHIAVERNRRRQMNDHLSALRSLMPSSYIHRGDQASIIGGAIDYVKELEQLHQSLQAQKRMKKSQLLDQKSASGGRGESIASTSTSTSSSTSTTTGILAATSASCMENCQLGNMKPEIGEGAGREGTVGRGYEFIAAKKLGAVEVHVTVIQNHVNLKVECQRREGGSSLLNAIVALEDIGLTVLHLNIMASENSAHYSFSLKIEEGCEIGSADGIAVVVHQIFSFINRTS